MRGTHALKERVNIQLVAPNSFSETTVVIPLVILAALFGACVGSFCNVLIVRLHEGSSIGGRSRCPHCGKTLTAAQLIPLVSWIVLRGHCASCRKSIHWQYPVVELAGALIGTIVFRAAWYPGGEIAWIMGGFLAFFLFALLVVAAFDLRWGLVPMEFTLGAAAIVGMLRMIDGASVASTLAGALATGGLLWLIVLLSRGRLMGEGDPAVGVLLGAALGWPLGIVAVGAAFLVGGLVAMLLLVARKVSRKTPVPFVPFLAVGAIMSYWWGESFLATLLYAFS